MADTEIERGQSRGPVPWGVLFLAAALFLVFVARLLIDVLHYRSFCPWRELTGYPCPTCFGLRALAALGRGELLTALFLHPLVTMATLVVVLWGLYGLVRLLWRPSWPAPALTPRVRGLLRWAVPLLFIANWALLCLHR
jgi:hypothetical protein